MILDNGGYPFKVRYNKSALELFRAIEEGVAKSRGSRKMIHVRWELIHTFTIKRAFVGTDDVAPEKYRAASAGNSMLFLLASGKYLYVGRDVYEFTADGDEIISYHSPIGNSSVPYPYAIGKRRTYLMLENMMAENQDIAYGDKDPYPKYYGTDKRLGVKGALLFTEFPIRTIEHGSN
jgi:hypothetical protein